MGTTQEKRERDDKRGGPKTSERAGKQARPIVVHTVTGRVWAAYFPPPDDWGLSREETYKTGMGVQLLLLIQKGLNSLDVREARELAKWSRGYMAYKEKDEGGLPKRVNGVPRHIIEKVIKAAIAEETGKYGPRMLAIAKDAIEENKGELGRIIAESVNFAFSLDSQGGGGNGGG